MHSISAPFRVVLVAFVLSLFSSSLSALSQQDTLIERVKALPGISDLEVLDSGPFNQKYQLFIEQPIDHKNLQLGTFKQRLFLMNVGFDRPTIIITEGYGANYGRYAVYPEELSRELNANVILVEHRYFYQSKPQGVGWEYLDAENSANDHHRVRQLFDHFYKEKWIATGISKGGQTALAYRAFFPDDVDITVPYVAPLCRGVEDGRHEPFLKEIPGSPEDRAALQKVQKEILRRRAELRPMFDSLVVAGGYNYNLPLDHIYDFTVLEYPFAFWQLGFPLTTLPKEGVPAKELFQHWVTVSSPDYWVNESEITPFFVQASKELGYYGYDTRPFKGLLAIKNAKGYLEKIFLPKGYKSKFNKKLHRKLSRFIKQGEEKMLFIYGEYDPWSAVMISEPKSENVVVFVEPQGSHRARISTLPEEMREEAKAILKSWLEE